MNKKLFMGYTINSAKREAAISFPFNFLFYSSLIGLQHTCDGAEKHCSALHPIFCFFVTLAFPPLILPHPLGDPEEPALQALQLQQFSRQGHRGIS